jgi:hypothetical protein
MVGRILRAVRDRAGKDRRLELLRYNSFGTSNFFISIGMLLFKQKRARNNYPIPLEDSSPREEGGDDDSNMNATDDDDEWGDARSTIRGILAGTGVLYQAEGIAFAHSCVPSKLRPGMTSHRFFVNGEMWQSECRSDDETHSLNRLFRVVSNYRRL